MSKRIRLDNRKIFLTSESSVYKTESFVHLSKRIADIDIFVLRIAEGLILNEIDRKSKKTYVIRTANGLYTVTLSVGIEDGRVGKKDFVFSSVSVAEEMGDGMDRRLSDYLSAPYSDVMVEEGKKRDEDLSRLYLVSGRKGINFPLLNENQRKIVETENANMLVQGVAGSGKTNVCVEKIVYCACRQYRGKVLYTTFSRGLLTETNNRVSLFLHNIEDFLAHHDRGEVIYLDGNHKKAVENRLGIFFTMEEEKDIVDTLRSIAFYLKNKVDYKLIEDIYFDYFAKRKRVVGERNFINEYLGEKNYRLSGVFDRVRHLSAEIVYKEIFGMIFGKHVDGEMLTKAEYIEERKDSFSKFECEGIYQIAVDYLGYLKRNDLVDNNLMSREILEKITDTKYSVGIIDEAQDFTQVNLQLIKKLSTKLFCVGDALQMINPSYFSFGYVKRLMYGDVTGVAELKHNYRSTERIENIAERLGQMNVNRFGTHSFVLRGESIRSDVPTEAIFVNSPDFYRHLNDEKYDNVTIVVGSRQKKEKLKKHLGKIEVLTVAEAKGLERDTVILIDVLSDNIDKWKLLQRASVNRKTADENSVFRYYYNLFYVGISRARQYLFVAEKEYPEIFEGLFSECFEKKRREEALDILTDIAIKIELDDEEFLRRIREFCALEQYDNAYLTADRIEDDKLSVEEKNRIFVHENYLRYGEVRKAGIEYWKRGMYMDAKDAFLSSGDSDLIPLMDACIAGGGKNLDINIVKFFPSVKDNDDALQLIIDTVKGDKKSLWDTQKSINDTLKRKRSKK